MCIVLHLSVMNELILPVPNFDSEEAQLIFDLEQLRDRAVRGSTPAWLFFDLKEIMHQLESLTSARIEGNRTTIMNVVEDVIEGSKETNDESIMELRNIQNAIRFIEYNINADTYIDKAIICELHKIVVKDLMNDGSKYPGKYRPKNVSIKDSTLETPHHAKVPDHMEELIKFLNEKCSAQYDLLQTATVHHHFTAIHPFDNGNGRTVRLLTYAMLTKQGFIDDKGIRLLNPSAVFCMDRQLYYDKLAKADEGGEKNMLEWCNYVLSGIKLEMEKISKLLDVDFAHDNIILPALEKALEKKQINTSEYDILRIATHKSPIQRSDIQHLFGPSKSAKVAASRTITRLKNQNFLMVHPKYKQKYVLRFANNYLLRGVMEQLSKFDLLPIKADS